MKATDKIAGYADMTAEEKLAALEKFEFNDGSAEIDKLKRRMSEVNSQAADLKRQLNSRMTEDEQREAETNEVLESMKAELEQLRREKTISGYRAEFLALGMDDKTTASCAAALADGDTGKVFNGLKSFLESMKQTLEADALNKQPELSGGNPANDGTVSSKADFLNLSTEKQINYIKNHPNWQNDLK